MDAHLFGIVEGVLVFGTVVGWGWWELRSTRRARREREARERAAQQDAPP